MLKHIITRQLIIAALAFHAVACAASESSLCKALPGTPQDIAATPRPDENLELLALRLSDSVTADEATYQRLVRDLASIRALEPAVRSIGYFSPFHGEALYVSFDDPQYAKVRDRDYHAWDCLNEHLNVTSVSPTSRNGVSLTFKGRFNVPKLAALYSKLPGVRFAEPVLAIGGGSTIYVTTSAGAWHYVFANATGDCVAGCMETDAYYFVVEAEERPRFLGSWHSGSAAKEPRPQWMEQYVSAVKRRWRQQAKP